MTRRPLPVDQRHFAVAIALTRRLGGNVTVRPAEIRDAFNHSAVTREDEDGITVFLPHVIPATYEQRVLELADEDPERFQALIAALLDKLADSAALGETA